MPIDRDRHRARLLRFTREAFGLLPPREWQRVLDLGCGSGLPTLELVRLTRGEVVALDRDPAALAALRRRVAAVGADDRVPVVRGTLTALPLCPASFDLVWAEGCIDVLGFAEGLRSWGELLMPGGFLVVHDAARDLGRKEAQVAARGYDLVGSVEVPGKAWWESYYLPLLAEAEALARGGDAARLAELEDIRREAGDAGTAPERMRSVFLLMRKPE